MRKVSCLLISAALFASLAGTRLARSQTPDNGTADLLKKVHDLEASLAEVKAELAQRGLATPAAVSSEVSQPPAPAALAPVADTSVSDASQTQTDNHVLGPLEFRGYSDFGFGRPLFEKLPPGGLAGSTQSFTLGDFDLFVNARINDHLNVLGELLVTSDFTNEFGAEMDRLMLTYSANKYFSISAGRYNTAIGYYTNAFHRARYFQTTVSRPILFSDEDNGGILPVHSTGLSATGLLPSGKAGLHWVAEVANGTASQNKDAAIQQIFADENNGKAFNVALYARPEGMQGLDVGVSFYRDRLHPVGLNSIEQRIYSAHAALVRPHLELISEGVLMRHEIVSLDHAANIFSGYGQASYLIHSIRPYIRYEYQNIPASDPIFGALGRQNGPSVGVRYDFSDFGAIKVQYGLLGVRSGPSTNAVQAQLAFAF